MKTYVLVRRQGSEGCDYTIGCGVAVTTYKDESLAAMLTHLLDCALEEDELRLLADPADDGLASAHLYEVSNGVELPLAQWRANAAQTESDALERERERQERTELARLKAKYEK